MWSGSAFNCPGASNEIILRHSRFSIGTSGVCSNGEIVARSLRVENNIFVSELSVEVTEKQTIECSYGNGAQLIFVGNASINLISGKKVENNMILIYYK